MTNLTSSGSELPPGGKASSIPSSSHLFAASDCEEHQGQNRSYQSFLPSKEILFSQGDPLAIAEMLRGNPK